MPKIKITKVEPHSNAEVCGIEVGDFMLFSNGKSLTNKAVLLELVESTDVFLAIQIVRANGQSVFIERMDEPFGVSFREVSDSELKTKFDYTSFVAVSTTPEIPNREIDYSIDLITAECVYGMNLFSDLFMEFRDVFGGRSATVQKAFKDARTIAMDELRREALEIGGNAIVGIDLDYNEISGGGKRGMLLLVASGTAVKLKA